MSKIKKAVAAKKLTSARLLKNRPAESSTDDTDTHTAGLGVIGRALAQIGEVDTVEEEIADPPVHPDLMASKEDALTPVAVQNGRMLATYIGLGLERNKEKEKLVHLDFSFPLEAAHSGLIPHKVEAAMDFLVDTGDKMHACQDLPLVTLDVYLDPKEKKSLLHLAGAQFTKAIVMSVEETGKTKVVEVIRFNFRLLVERTPDVIKFAAWRDGEQFWITLPGTQKDLDL